MLMSTADLGMRFLPFELQHWASLVVQFAKSLPAKQETQVRCLGWGAPLEKGMATHSSTLAWRIPWTEEPGGLQPVRSHRSGHDWAPFTYTFFRSYSTKSPPRSQNGLSIFCASNTFHKAVNGSFNLAVLKICTVSISLPLSKKSRGSESKELARHCICELGFGPISIWPQKS